MKLFTTVFTATLLAILTAGLIGGYLLKREIRAQSVHDVRIDNALDLAATFVRLHALYSEVGYEKARVDRTKEQLIEIIPALEMLRTDPRTSPRDAERINNELSMIREVVE